ncbi:heme exporter protein D [Arcanobacterium pluranimalium]|uniref:hypothetical protein n=1 Tax=Arcanobacterium pluranimalium TaxID=108028 RepID=UPI001959F89F|nr:hypothetical protein [Arcanobacterium pluranimalium]MBM7825474.1 heme exporter protein D [Arcanobacterium pluranimalium]
MPSLFIWLALALAVVVALVVIAGVITARKLNALHVNAVKSRRLLENALYSRAQHAQEFADRGVLDIASAVLLKSAAQEAAHAVDSPLVNDGLDLLASAGHVSIDAAECEDIVDYANERSAKNAADRLSVESELSRVLQLTVDELDRDELDQDTQILLNKLERDRRDVRMTRRFHNIHVSQARRVRRSRFTRSLRLAGRAPMPQTVDLVD